MKWGTYDDAVTIGSWCGVTWWSMAPYHHHPSPYILMDSLCGRQWCSPPQKYHTTNVHTHDVSSTDHMRAQRRWGHHALPVPLKGSTLRLYHIESIYHQGFQLITTRRLAMLFVYHIIITKFLWVSMNVMWMARSESGLIPRWWIHIFYMATMNPLSSGHTEYFSYNELCKNVN